MKLKKSNAGKVLTVSLLLIGIGFASCKKEVDPTANSEEKKGIETWKTLEDYPSEITLDNWEEFVYAPKEVIAHFEEMERLNSCSSNTQKTLTPTPGDGSLMPVGPNGLIQFYQGVGTDIGLVQFPGVTVHHCNYQIVSDNSGASTNYSLPGSCNFNICMAVEPITNPNGIDFTEPLVGVTVLDIVLMQKHILGIEVFTEPAQYIAADVNGSGTVSGSDIVAIRKLILGMKTDWTNSDNYLFIDSNDYANFGWWDLYSYSHTDPCNEITSNNRIGVKTGDVNGSLANYF